jgi:hypothetical protein
MTVAARTAALDGDDPVDALPTPEVEDVVRAAARRDCIDRHIGRPRTVKSGPASVLAKRVGCEAADQAGADETERQEGRTGWPVCLGGGWIAPGHEEARDHTNSWGGRRGQRRGRTPQAASGCLKYSVHTTTDVVMKQSLNPVDSFSHVCQIGKWRPGDGYAHVSAG